MNRVSTDYILQQTRAKNSYPYGDIKFHLRYIADTYSSHSPTGSRASPGPVPVDRELREGQSKWQHQGKTLTISVTPLTEQELRDRQQAHHAAAGGTRDYEEQLRAGVERRSQKIAAAGGEANPVTLPVLRVDSEVAPHTFRMHCLLPKQPRSWSAVLEASGEPRMRAVLLAGVRVLWHVMPPLVCAWVFLANEVASSLQSVFFWFMFVRQVIYLVYMLRCFIDEPGFLRVDLQASVRNEAGENHKERNGLAFAGMFLLAPDKVIATATFCDDKEGLEVSAGVLSFFKLCSGMAIAASLGASALASGGDHELPGVVLLAHGVPAASILYTSVIGIVLGVGDYNGATAMARLQECGLLALFGIGSVWLLVLWVVLAEYAAWAFVIAFFVCVAVVVGDIFADEGPAGESGQPAPAYMGILVGVCWVAFFLGGELLTDEKRPLRVRLDRPGLQPELPRGGLTRAAPWHGNYT